MKIKNQIKIIIDCRKINFYETLVAVGTSRLQIVAMNSGDIIIGIKF